MPFARPGPRHPAPRPWRRRLIACVAGAVLGLAAGAMDTGTRFGARCQEARSRLGTVRILHFGDSHLAADGTSQTFREGFASLCGDAGPGLGLPWQTRLPGVKASASAGWRQSRKAGGDGRMGLQGGYLEARRSGERAVLEGRLARFRLHLLAAPGAGRVRILVDQAVQEDLDLASATERVVVVQRTYPFEARPHRIELQTLRDGPVRILGVALEGPAGAVYSRLAFNGARAAWLAAMPEPLFQGQLAAEAPDLIVLAFGTNEANEPAFRAETYRRSLDELLVRFQRTCPAAALVLVGPPDGRLAKGRPGTLEQVIAVQRAAAHAIGAPFVDQRALMGGPGAMDAWLRSGWANPDRVHLLPPAYRWLAQATLRGMLQGLGQGHALLALPAQDPGPGSRPPASARPEPAPPAAPRPLYTFRYADGRVLITDDPTKADGQEGEWIGRQP